jgi:DNA-binding transcriptional LysR family regulator
MHVEHFAAFGELPIIRICCPGSQHQLANSRGAGTRKDGSEPRRREVFIGMGNIPTDLLRTLVAVVDHGGFTQAARVLGVTQPAVSTHIKRLQTLLGGELFDRSGRRPSLTSKGAQVVSRARRMLTINDEIVEMATIAPSTRWIRLGIPEDFLGANFPRVFAGIRKKYPNVCFTVERGSLDQHLDALRRNELDVIFGVSREGIPDARHHWTEGVAWVRGRSTSLDGAGMIPLVSFSEDYIYHRMAVDALSHAGRESEIVFKGPTVISLAAAVGMGFGIMALPRSRVWLPHLMIWDDAPLPPLPEVVWSVAIREGAGEPVAELADLTAAELRTRTETAARRDSARLEKDPIPFTRRAKVS